MIGFFKKLKMCFNRWLFWKKVSQNSFLDDVFYTNWRENNKCLNKSFKEEVLNVKKW